ncbi:MAG: archaellin/type IV pilin N-terminal domain-containing protein [Halodesulfurarchaeum sp.]
MTRSDPHRHERGQIGVGTIVILIAVLLVAATTAGVLFNVTGLLQSRADVTGEAVRAEVGDPIRVAAVTGRVNETADPRVLTRVRVIVELEAGSNVDLSQASIRLRAPGTSQFLQYDPEDPIRGERFTVSALSDPDGSAPVLTEPGDTFAVVIDTPALRPYEPVTLRITLDSGASTTVEFRVPARVRTRSAVSLG